ncbi:NACHT domain-containing protein [Shimazuella kribbensis]|uniref:NACHT domain-containing protein n=1 Tax=Shimazuella kribbensis TaxID=139808 RepID=UPI0004085176|nr:hypothetical protein [Shimazuella kribbensis]
MTLPFNCKRFWLKRGSKVNDFLSDPESKNSFFYSDETITLEADLDTPIIILLGEPGIGKSHSLDLEFKKLEEKKNSKHTVMFKDLRQYGSEDRLIKDLFNNKEMEQWINGDYNLYIFLDSFDECLLRIDQLSSIISENIKNLPADRLYLRIACRTAGWPSFLENELKKHWGDNSINCLELAPLREKDVINVLNFDGIDSDKFLKDLDLLNATPLATIPLTLHLLINEYKQSGTFPNKQSNLYLDGCIQLCEEHNESRTTSRQAGNLSARQRLLVASRIATLTMLSNRYSIWLGKEFESTEEDLKISEIINNGWEEFLETKVEVNDDSIKETLGTGLFSSRGLNRLGWAHQSYAEFLTALYLKNSILSNKQILNFLIDPYDPKEKIAPQLREVASRLITLDPIDPSLIKDITKRDPEVVLRSDIGSYNSKAKQELVSILLDLYDQQKILDDEIDLDKHYSKLNHPNLYAQIVPYISNKDKNVFVRRASIRIAKACNLVNTVELLTNISLDKSEEYQIRIHAAITVMHIGDAQNKLKLKSLIDCENDIDDELKGIALKGLWPNLISTEELFNVLTPPKNDNLFGVYKSLFYFDDISGQLSESDLFIALQWIKNSSSGFKKYTQGEFIKKIFKRAWEFLFNANILDELSHIVFSRLVNHEDKYLDQELLLSDDKKRYLLIDKFAQLLKQDISKSYYVRNSIIFSQDLDFLIKNLLSSKELSMQTVWSELILWIFDSTNRTHVDSILEVALENQILNEVMSNIIGPVDLLSKQATTSKKRYYRKIDDEKKNNETEILVINNISSHLYKMEQGDLDSWWHLNCDLSFTNGYNEFESDLTKYRLWIKLTHTTKTKIQESAKKYILEKKIDGFSWIKPNTISRPEYAGFRAFQLMLKVNPEFVKSLSTDIWKNWASVFIAYPVSSENEDIQQNLIELAYRNAPKELSETMKVLIEHENNSGHLFILQKLSTIWNQSLSDILLSLITTNKLSLKNTGEALSFLIGKNYGKAIDLAESLIASKPDSKVSILIASKLLLFSTKTHWDTIWPLVIKENDIAKKVIENIATDHNKDLFLSKFTEEQLSTLFIFLEDMYPSKDDTKLNGFYTLRNHITDLKRDLINKLRYRGTQKSLFELKKIIDQFPKTDYFKWILLDAEKITSFHCWHPHKPSDIINVIKQSNLRLVENGNQLLDVILECLQELENDLQSETPQARFLWDKCKNTSGNTTYKPVDENELSDYIKHYLDKTLKMRGIIVNREVEIRKGYGNKKGERTDIQVDAVIKNNKNTNYDVITVIIEVKGCWHQEIRTAMETQLVNRYLLENECRNGLYLVGWFNCDHWDKADSRYSKRLKCSLKESKEYFDHQAKNLSKSPLNIKPFILNASL